MEWVPAIADRDGPLYLRIVDALRSDISAGRLRRGEQLPTQRALAKVLGIDLTTVTRAYAEARRCGLTDARVGQGTFVAESASQSPRAEQQRTEIDLSMNIPPQPLEADLEGRILRGLAAIQSETGYFGLLNYRPPGGTLDERSIAASWMSRRAAVSPDSVLISAGSQTAALAFLLASTAPGDVVLTEAVTFPGFRAAAAQARVRLAGIPMDGEGVDPDALDTACKRHKPKAVYLIPTMQNPTGATQSAARRKSVADVISKHGLLFFEDDAYGLLAPEVAPIASLIPEHTYWAVSLSKCLAPGLRVSFLRTPDAAAAARMTGALRATVQMAPPLMVALVTRWISDGSADDIIAAIRNEAAARQKIAAHKLAGIAYSGDPRGHHIWLPLPQQWSRAAFLAHVQRQGLALVAGEAFSIGEPPHAIRLSLGAPRTRADLAMALDILAAAFRSAVATAHIV